MSPVGILSSGVILSRAVRLLVAAFVGVGIAGPCARADETVGIRQVQAMPDLPSPCVLRDWKQVTIGLDKLMFDPNATGQYMPLLRLAHDDNHNVIGFGFPDYV